MFRVERADEELQVQRSKMILNLDNAFASLHLKGVLIFDAHLQPGEGAKGHGKALDIVYTSSSQTADEAIIEQLQTLKPASWIVVTSDKRLAWRVRRNGFKTESVEQFLTWLKKRVQTKKKKDKEGALFGLGSSRASTLPLLSIPTKKLPSLQAIPEECFDYYLEVFQRTPESEEHKKKKVLKKKQKIIQSESNPKESTLSEFERWLKAFQNGGG